MQVVWAWLTSGEKRESSESSGGLEGCLATHQGISFPKD